MVIPALVGGVFLGVTSALPLVEFINCACCVLVIGGGVLAAVLYTRDYPDYLPPVSYGDAAVLGILTGVIGGFVWTIVDVPLELAKLHLGMGMMDMSELSEVLDDPNIPPEARAILTSLFEHGGFTIGWIIFALLLNIIFGVIFATLGAIIGVALFQKKPAVQQPPQAPGPQPPGPQPPIGT
jgi:hypothetical protein